jgi:hypothetical protein
MSFINEDSNKFDVIEFLSDLGDPIVNNDINELVISHTLEEKKELIEDVLLHVGDIIGDKEYSLVDSELRKLFLKNK